MKTRVTALVAPDLVELTRKSADAITEMSLVTDVFYHPKDAVELFEQYVDQSDVLLFGGPLAYSFVQDYINTTGITVNKPMLHFPYTEVSIYRALFTMSKQIKAGPHSPDTMSVDFPAESDIRECLEELEINLGQAFMRECRIDYNFDELAGFHYQLWKQGRAQVAMSSVYLVYQNLRKLGVPVYRIAPAKSSIRHAVHSAFLEGKTAHQAQSQIAVGIISLDIDGRFINKNTPGCRTRRSRLALERLLIDFGEGIQALIDWPGKDELRFITTRGEIERDTDGFRQMPILEKIESALGVAAGMGVGFGHTASEAERKSYEAAAKAKTAGSGSCFVVEMNGMVTRLSGNRAQLKYSTRSDNPELLLVAKAAGLSVGTINKLLACIDNSGEKRFTAFDLACGFDITLRSARRILGKLEESGFVTAFGEEQPVSKGRPRRVYRLNFKV